MSFKSAFKHWLWGWTHHDPYRPFVEFKLNQGWKARRYGWPPEYLWIDAVNPGQAFGGLSELQLYVVVVPGKAAVLTPYEPNSVDEDTHDWNVWR